MTQIPLKTVWASSSRWSSCSPSMSSDRRGRRRSETDGFPHGGSASPTTHSQPGSSAHSATTPGALSQHRDHWRCSPAAQSCASRVPCSAVPPQPHIRAVSGTRSHMSRQSLGFQHQSCLDQRGTMQWFLQSPCLNLGPRHSVSQCCLPWISIFICPIIDNCRLVLVWQSMGEKQLRG